ncbi:MAG: hypothetical protein J2P56_01500, partial [Verrucomicrobia bacterium]|nr:hypothetical protein [Verrucomicrobiota bacterium]
TIVGGVAVIFAFLQYRANSRLERARWLASLYEKFYEKDQLKGVRQTLDSADRDASEISKLVTDEPSEFTDYLNFFEFVAVLEKSGQLKSNEIEDLFHYYLDCLEKSPKIREYLAAKGYEHLDEFLRARAKVK